MTEHKQISTREFNLARSCNIGSRNLSDTFIMIYNVNDKLFSEKEVKISEAMIKVIDEILANACDHFYKKYNSTNPVTYISVKYNKAKNIIVCKNDGFGIPIIKEWDGAPENNNDYLPKILFSEENVSSNYDDNEKDRIQVGLNGKGSVLVNTYSKIFQITTIDSDRKLKYSVQFYDNMDYTKNEKVINCKDKSYTEVMWLPDYDRLCSVSGNWIKESGNSDLISNIIFNRILQISVFINTVNFSHKLSEKITYNKKPTCSYNSTTLRYNLEDYVKMHGLKNYIKIYLTNLRFPWYIIIGLKDELKLIKKRAGLYSVSLINSNHLCNGGSHVNLITNILIKHLEKIAGIDISTAQFNNIFCYFDCKHIPIDQFDFGSQTKNKITMKTEHINRLRKIINISDNIISKLWSISETHLMVNVVKKDMNKKLSMIGKSEGKHDPAENRNKKNSNCGLFIPEGDSACTPIRNMIKHKKTPIDKKNYGTYIIQGVPPNAIKNIVKIYKDESGKSVPYLNDKLLFSRHFNCLMNCIGLKYQEHYKKNNEGNAQFTRLKYKHIIMATDQDLDGIGHICSLVMVFIMRFWPALIERDFFRRLATPLVRVYRGKNKVKEFYAEKDYNNWVIQTYRKLENIPNNLDVKYYKGLSSNSEKEMYDIGMNISNNIFVMKKDLTCMDLMNQLYGKDTVDRKKILTKEVIQTYNPNIWKTHNINISDHFNIETVEFQLSNMRRKLKNFIDGMIPSQRKVLCGSRSLFSNSNKPMKIFQIGGNIVSKMCYDHGDASLNEVITKMAHTFDGGNNIPQLLPCTGGFGTKTEGRGRNGQPRYIYAKYNKLCDLMYPKKDDPLLEYVYEDGLKCEPKYYIPILPISILENEKTPGTGWKITVWARDYDAVVKYVKSVIFEDTQASLKKDSNEPVLKDSFESLNGKLWNRHNKIKFMVDINNVEYCYGKYHYDKKLNRIIIDDLPIRVWSKSFKNKHLGINPKTEENFKIDREGEKIYLSKTPFIKHIQDDTANHIVDMYIEFEKNGYEDMKKYCDDNDIDIVDFLKLRKKLTSELNMINDKNYITEFTNYESIIKSWYPFRKKLYIERINREIIILQIKINLSKNTLRFIEMDAEKNKKINIDKNLQDSERIKILENHKFAKFNMKNYNNMKEIKTSELEIEIYKNNSNFDYIDSITIKNKSMKSISSLKDKILKLEDELNKTKNITWDKLWISEIDEFTIKLKDNLKKNWE